ncbi:MAG: PHP domain-containing protein, partial [Candidatus Omnitrophica bacterium]|nr:PHP domain-containing protein [Candidatus Omnitrophota bacterium]
MEWIPPELREDRGEIEAARTGRLPGSLIEAGHIRGDLHMHSTATDGRNTIEEMALAARHKGYEYIAIADHSKFVKVAHGLNEKQLLKQIDMIRKIDSRVKGIRILAGVEVDILKNGNLDLDDSVLKELDVVIAAVHSHFSLDMETQTARVLRGMENRYVNILAHPSGRLITRRSPMHLDFDRIFTQARDVNIYLEINTHGKRIDLNDVHCRRAKALGAKFAINTDSHDTAQLDQMIYGIVAARRGWLEKNDVLNTRSLASLIKALKR